MYTATFPSNPSDLISNGTSVFASTGWRSSSDGPARMRSRAMFEYAMQGPRSDSERESESGGINEKAMQAATRPERRYIKYGCGTDQPSPEEKDEDKAGVDMGDWQATLTA